MISYMTTKKTAAIDRSIYTMPMFVSMLSSDLSVAEETYNAIGFITLATIPGPENETQLLHLRREKYQDILIATGAAQQGTLTASFAAGSEDVDELATRLTSDDQFQGTVEGQSHSHWCTKVCKSTYTV